jgi:hypothetical protein
MTAAFSISHKLLGSEVLSILMCTFSLIAFGGAAFAAVVVRRSAPAIG